LGEELRPSFAVRCSRRLSGLPLLATLLHDALGVRVAAIQNRIAVANANRIAFCIETSHRVLVFR
jgi:hypothetical protein